MPRKKHLITLEVETDCDGIITMRVVKITEVLQEPKEDDDEG